MKLGADNEIPLYQQLKEEIKAAIENGTFPGGTRIPTGSELSEKFDVSRITVKRTVRELCQGDYLSKKQGKGTFVKHTKVKRKIEHLLNLGEACKANGMVPSRLVTERKLMKFSEEDARVMGVETNSTTVHIQRINPADGFSVMHESNCFPYPRCKLLLDKTLDGSLYQLSGEEYNIIISSSASSYSDIVWTSGDLSKMLNVPSGEPLSFLYTETHDVEHRLVHIGEQYIVGDQYRLYLKDYTKEL